MQITSPLSGATITRPDVMVEGTVSNALGNETGVTVNGVVALVHNGQFVANHVPLEEGQNTLTVKAVDSENNTTVSAVTNTATITGGHILVRARPDAGGSPLIVDLNIEVPFVFAQAEVSPFGPAVVESLGGSGPANLKVRMTAPGIYFLTAEVRDPVNNPWRDTVAVLVWDRAELDALLRAKWEAMKQALVAQNVPRSLTFLTDDAKELYGDVFTVLLPRLPLLVQEMENIELIVVRSNTAIFRVWKNEMHGGQIHRITHHVNFELCSDGLWRIWRF
jgi:hypothetical protein